MARAPLFLLPVRSCRVVPGVLLALALAGCNSSPQPSQQESPRASASAVSSGAPPTSASSSAAAPDLLPTWSPPLGHTSGVRELAFSPDGSMLASSGGAGELLLWDVRSAIAIALLTKHVQAPDQLRWAPNGKLLASVRVSDLDMIDLAARKVLWTLHTHAGQVWSAIAWSKDSDGLVARTSDDAVQWIGVTAGKALCAARHSEQLSTEEVPACDGVMKAKLTDSSHGDPLIASEWDGKPIHESLRQPEPRNTCISSDWKYAAVVPDNKDRIEIRDARTGAKRTAIATNQGLIEELAFADSDRALIVAGFENHAQMYALPQGARKLDVLAGWNGVSAVSLHPASSTLATASGLDASVMLWDTTTGALRRRLTPGVISYGFPKVSPGGSRLIAYSTETGLHAWELAGSKVVTLSGPFEDLEGWGWGEDDSVAWLVSRDGKITKVDAGTGRASVSGKLAGWPDLSHDSARPQVEFGPGGKYVVVRRHTAVHVWDVKTRRAVRLTGSSEIDPYWTAFSPSGAELAVGTWGNAQVFDLAAGKPLARWDWHPVHRKRALNSTKGDAFLAMQWAGPFVLAVWHVSGQGTTLELWDPAHGTKVSSAVCKEGYSEFEFSPQADRVLVDAAGVVDVRTCEPVPGTPGGGRGRFATWGPKGDWYATAPGDGLFVHSTVGKPTVSLHPVATDDGWSAFSISSTGDFAGEEKAIDRVELRWQGRVLKARELYARFGKTTVW